MPKKMSLEYEYDDQAVAAAVTQLELSSHKGPSCAAGSRDNGQPRLPPPLQPQPPHQPSASCCPHPAFSSGSSRGPRRPRGTAGGVGPRRCRRRGRSPRVVAPGSRPGRWVWFGLAPLMQQPHVSQRGAQPGVRTCGICWLRGGEAAPPGAGHGPSGAAWGGTPAQGAVTGGSPPASSTLALSGARSPWKGSGQHRRTTSPPSASAPCARGLAPGACPARAPQSPAEGSPPGLQPQRTAALVWDPAGKATSGPWHPQTPTAVPGLQHPRAAPTREPEPAGGAAPIAVAPLGAPCPSVGAAGPGLAHGSAALRAAGALPGLHVPDPGLGEGAERGFAPQPGQLRGRGGQGGSGVWRDAAARRLSGAVPAPGAPFRPGFPKFRRLRDAWNKLLVTRTPTLPDSRGI